MAVLRSLILWMAVVFLTVAFFLVIVPTCLLAMPFDRKKNVPHWFARSWARSLLRANPANVISIKGEENLAKIGGQGAAVLCANHESMADITALFYLGHPFKWISKQSLFYVPMVGWTMWLAGYIPLKRGKKDSILRCMEKAGEWLQNGVSIAMFPEGTRSIDGRVKPFKDGAFRLAVDYNVPIVPIALEGPRSLLNKGSWLFAPRAHLVVRVGEPMFPRGKGADEVERLKNETRAWILTEMASMKGVSVESLDAARVPEGARKAS
jgi:1-acyl-sn-glycerol-3-phosphate acyltransferase